MAPVIALRLQIKPRSFGNYKSIFSIYVYCAKMLYPKLRALG